MKEPKRGEWVYTIVPWPELNSSLRGCKNGTLFITLRKYLIVNHEAENGMFEVISETGNSTIPLEPYKMERTVKDIVKKATKELDRGIADLESAKKRLKEIEGENH